MSCFSKDPRLEVARSLVDTVQHHNLNKIPDETISSRPIVPITPLNNDGEPASVMSGEGRSQPQPTGIGLAPWNAVCLLIAQNMQTNQKLNRPFNLPTAPSYPRPSTDERLNAFATPYGDRANNRKYFVELNRGCYDMEGPRCTHVARWKRLRAKRGFTYFVCYECGVKWRLRSIIVQSPAMASVALAANSSPVSSGFVTPGITPSVSMEMTVPYFTAFYRQ